LQVIRYIKFSVKTKRIFGSSAGEDMETDASDLPAELVLLHFLEAQFGSFSPSSANIQTQLSKILYYWILRVPKNSALPTQLE
jgi:predicted nucleotidyltransferase